MRAKQKIFAIALLVLLAASIYAFVRTGGDATQGLAARGKPAAAAGAPLVDQTPLLTVQRLVQMPTTAAESPHAQEALRLADREMDLAFAAAVRDAEEHPPVLNAAAKELESRIQKSEDALDADKKRVDQLTAQVAKATGARQDALQDQLKEGKAQLDLDQDEIDEAKEDLKRAGGNLQDRIEALTQQHDASSQSADTTKIAVSPPVQAHGLIQLYQQWAALHGKQRLIERARQAAESAAALFASRHNELDSKVAAEVAKAPEPAASGNAPAAEAGNGAQGRDRSAARVSATKRRSANQKALASFDQRLDDQKKLAQVYAAWSEVVAAEQQSLVHGALRGAMIVLAIALVSLYFGAFLDHLVGRLKMDRRQVQSLRTVAHVALRLVALLLILLVIMGPPGQLGTFLGLAGAGLTVALKDFIVGFIGWFVLMGKNGMRLGDWVEINGVTGEVVEIGPFHTVLLETGNWTDSGHPTGRRVTFTNSFAIEGHYFNFSTSGQWLWDELTVVLPSGQDPYPIVDAIHNQVQAATSHSASEAESEWRKATGSREMSAFSVAPAISVKPVLGGVEVAVRYITRANQRYQLRAKLYQMLVHLLGGRGEAKLGSSEAHPASAD